MKKINLLILLCFLNAQENIYSTVQMLDEVRIINSESLQIVQSVMTEFSSDIINCMDYSDQMSCDMLSNCEWTMDMCMESSNDCMDYSDAMSCNMSSGCEWMMDMCMEDMDNQETNTPHFIALDETNGYWFVTTIASGYVAQFSLIDNSLVDTYFVGDAPALLAIDIQSKIIYCSRMMPMNGMGNMMPDSESNVIQALNYSAMGLAATSEQEYLINSPAPHGLAIKEDGSEIYTASNTADWLYKIDISTGDILGVPMDAQVNNPPDQTTQRLKPIQCLSVGNKLFVSCSAGPWMNPWTGEQTVIPGILQMWDATDMSLIDTFEFEEYSSPWHIKESPIDQLIYVVLSGDNLYNTESVASIRFDNDDLSLEWQTYNDNFEILHGIDVSNDGQNIYVSGRGDGNIHKLNASGEYLDNVFLGSMSMLGGLVIEKKGLPDLGDLNNDSIINITDVVLGVNIIFNPMMSTPYQLYACDFNIDSTINIIDIVLIVNIILGIE